MSAPEEKVANGSPRDSGVQVGPLDQGLDFVEKSSARSPGPL